MLMHAWNSLAPPPTFPSPNPGHQRAPMPDTANPNPHLCIAKFADAVVSFKVAGEVFEFKHEAAGGIVPLADSVATFAVRTGHRCVVFIIREVHTPRQVIDATPIRICS
jgi:hypothetical protein